jgi:hypothetical protein
MIQVIFSIYLTNWNSSIWTNRTSYWFYKIGQIIFEFIDNKNLRIRVVTAVVDDAVDTGLFC